MFKLGYLVPEFPGQTHIFFWREIARLQEMDCELSLVSTRPPPLSIRSHDWTEEAQKRTQYLFPSKSFGTLFALLIAVASFSPVAWWRCLVVIWSTRGGRLQLLACALFAARLARIAEREAWDHLHVHSCAKSASIASFARLLTGLEYSITLHGPLSDYGPHQDLKWSLASFGIVITDKLWKEVHEELAGSLPQRVAIAPMGVNVATFQRPSPYQAWDKVGPAKIFSTGRLNPCKGHAELIQAVAALRDAGIPVRLEIAGEDEQGGSGYRKELQRVIDHLNVGDAVKLLGAVSEARVRQGLLESHVFALASHGEPLGVAIMEAMALDLPVLVTAGGGVRELVTHGYDGYLVEMHDVASIAYGLDRILFDAELARHLSRNARQTIIERFQDDRSADVLLRLAQKACPVGLIPDVRSPYAQRIKA